MSSELNLVPEGYYEAVAVPTQSEDGTICTARLAWSKNDTRKVVVAFELLNGGEHTGRRLFWDGYFTKDSARRTVESLRFMGFIGDDLADVENQALDQKVSVKVGHNEWDGKVYARVDFVNKAGGASIKIAKPMSLHDKKKFAAMMQASIAGVPEFEGERRANGQTERAVMTMEHDPINAEDGDGIPF